MANTFADLTFPSADGRLQLYARDYPGQDPALLMMHGLTRNSADFANLAEHLIGRHRLVVPDQRGRGRSDFDPDPANYLPPVYCADMLALISRLGLDRPVLVGTSMGGLMAMAMAAVAPRNFRGLILNDAGPDLNPTGLARIAAYIGRNMAVRDWQEAAAYTREINGAAFPRYDEQGWMRFAERIFVEQPQTGLRLAYDPAIAVPLAALEGTSTLPDLWPLWEQLRGLPVLLIRGELSDVLTVQAVARMKGTHTGLHVCTVPHVGHAPMLDEPEAIAAIAQFLAELEQSRD